MLNILKFLNGLRIVPKTNSSSTALGELDVSSSDSKLNFHNGSSSSPVITEAHSATVTNKSLVDDSVLFVYNGDDTAKIRFDLSLIAPGQTRVYTLPDANSSFVGGTSPTTDTAIAKWNGTFGDTLSNSGVLINVFDQLLATDGTASDPSYTFGSETTTGLYYSATGDIGIGLQGRNSLHIAHSPTLQATTLHVPQTDPLYAGLYLTSSDSAISGQSPGPLCAVVGNATAGNTDGGKVQFAAGQSFGSGTGGAANFFSGGASSTGNAGTVSIGGGAATGTGTGGTINIGSGVNSSTGNGGPINIFAGDSSGGNGGATTISGGTANTVAKAAGALNLRGGLSTAGTTGPINFFTGTSSYLNRGSISGAGLWTIGTAAGTQTHVLNGNLQVNAAGELRLADSDSSNYVAIKSEATVGSNYTISLPSTAPSSSTALMYNGSNYVWMSPSSSLSAVSVSSAYPILTSDDIIFYSSASGYTTTLPTAVGVAGKVYRLIKVSSDFNIVQLATTGGQTIAGQAASGFKLITPGETWELVSDGINWQVNEHKADTDWASFTMNITGTSVNPTKGTTTVDNAWWRRDGADLLIKYQYLSSVGGTAGTGRYLFQLPNSFVANTSILNTAATANCGAGSITDSITNYSELSANLFDSTHFIVVFGDGVSASAGFGSTTVITLATATAEFTFTTKIPIANWKS